MKRNRIKKYCKPLFIALISTAIFGCAGSSGGSRKKMPEFTGTGSEFSTTHLFETESAPDLSGTVPGFAMGYASMSFNGTTKECISVAVPAAADTQALALLSLYKPFAGVLIGQWAKQQRNGVVLDFRSSTGIEQKRAEYLLESQNNPAVPLIFLWDGTSAARVAAYMGQLADVPGVSVTQLNSK